MDRDPRHPPKKSKEKSKALSSEKAQEALMVSRPVDDSTNNQYYLSLNSGQNEVLLQIREEPTRADITWEDAERLFNALGASIENGRGSRVRVRLGSTRFTYHKPHPEKVLPKYAVENMREQLEEAGVPNGA